MEVREYVQRDNTIILEKSKKVIKIKLFNLILIFLVIATILGILSYIFSKPKVEMGKYVENIEVNTCYEENGIKAKRHKKDISDQVIITGDVDTSKVGEYKVSYKVPYLHGFVEYNKTVNVVDTESPTLELKGEKEIEVLQNEKYKEPGVIANDNYDGDITKNAKVKGKVDTSKIGTYTLTYKAADSSNNETYAERTVNVVENNKGTIYLTFDDGPTQDMTPKILDILKEKNVQATFFIINYGPEKEEIIEREIAEGHTIGIHGYSHTYSEVYNSVEDCINNFTSLQEKLKQLTGVDSKIIRFPGGSSNTISKKYCEGIMSVVTQKMTENGYKYFDWNISSEDAGGARNKEDVYNNVVSGLLKNRANVVLMHDFSGNTKTLDALSDIIDYGLANGYTFKCITESTPVVTHNVQN